MRPRANLVLHPFQLNVTGSKGRLGGLGIFICFRTDGSIFNLRRLLAHTKTIEVLIVELLFTDDCALLAHTQEALQYIVNRSVKAAKAFGFTISLKKTEVLHQSPPGGTYSPPQINIVGTSLNSIEHFTCLGSVISNDATVNKDLDKLLVIQLVCSLCVLIN